jgi:hypothetical protein
VENPWRVGHRAYTGKVHNAKEEEGRLCECAYCTFPMISPSIQLAYFFPIKVVSSRYPSQHCSFSSPDAIAKLRMVTFTEVSALMSAVKNLELLSLIA